MKYFLVIVFSLHCRYVLAQSDTAAIIFSLEDVINETVEQNIGILIARNNLEIAKNDNTLGNAGFLPRVDVNGNLDFSIQNTEQEFINGDAQTINGASRDFYSANVDLTWTVFDGTRMFAVKNRLESNQILNDLMLKAEMELAVASAITIFYELVLEKERLALFRDSKEFSEERVRIIKDKYDFGRASKVELLQAQVDLNSDRSAFINQQQVVATRKFELLAAIGLRNIEDFDVTYDFNQDTTLTLSSVLNEAKLKNPMLLAQKTNYEISGLRTKELLRGRFPEVDVNLGYAYSNLTSEAGFLFKNRTSAVNYGLTARINLFDGFNTQRQIQNAELVAENAELAYLDLEIELETLIKTAYVAYSNNLELTRLERANREVARENAQIELERFKIGASDALELRQAQNNAINATIRLIEAAANAKFAEIELKRLSGTLLTSS